MAVSISDDDIRQLARLARMEIAPGHVPGVIRNLETLWQQIDIMFEMPIDPVVEPIAAFAPK